MAEREGFEPPELSLNGFQDRRLKPLGHLSVENAISPQPTVGALLSESAEVAEHSR